MLVGIQRQHLIERTVSAAGCDGVDLGLARGGNDHERSPSRAGGLGPRLQGEQLGGDPGEFVPVHLGTIPAGR